MPIPSHLAEPEPAAIEVLPTRLTVSRGATAGFDADRATKTLTNQIILHESAVRDTKRTGKRDGLTPEQVSTKVLAANVALCIAGLEDGHEPPSQAILDRLNRALEVHGQGLPSAIRAAIDDYFVLIVAAREAGS